MIRCLAALAVTSVIATSSAQAQAQNLRLEIVAVEANNAVTAAIAGKRPSQWEGAVMQMVFDGKAKLAACATSATVTFTHMFSEKSGVRVDQNWAPGPYDLARFVVETRRIERTGAKASIVRQPVSEPAKPAGKYFYQVITVPLVGGGGAVYLPAGPVRASDNPVMGVALPGQTLRGLPENNTTGVRWSTPANAEYGTVNELHKSLGNQHNNDTVVLVVPPCGGGQTS